MKILYILTILFAFSQCGNTKFITNPSFTIATATYNNWVGGQPGVSGTKVALYLRNASAITFDSLYFNNRKTKVEVIQKEETTEIIGHFSTSNRTNRDLILDIDATKELQNTPPIANKIPFELKENEAILSYKKGRKTVYYKIKNIKKVSSLMFPSANKK